MLPLSIDGVDWGTPDVQMQWTSLPYLFDSFDEVDSEYNNGWMFQRHKEVAAQYGICLLENIENGFKCLIGTGKTPTSMDDLKGSIGLQSYAQRDPVTEYRFQGGEMFDAMVSDIRANTVRSILTVVPRERVERVQVAKPLSEGFEGTKTAPKKIVLGNAASQVALNAPCPCGSGKKYKRCCGVGAPRHTNNN